MATYEELQERMRNKCHITWNDSNTDSRVKNIVEDAVSYLHHKLGIPGIISPDPFMQPGMTAKLFDNYCMYEWNDVADQFEKNYRHDIITERYRIQVEAAKSEQEDGNI